MRSASLEGERHHRSAAEQIEYWASLGRDLAAFLDPDKLLDVVSGLATLRVESVNVSAVAPEQVFADLERQRRSGQLSKAVSQAAVRYQASQTHPGCLDAISADGTRCVGRFQHGAFIALDEAAVSSS